MQVDDKNRKNQTEIRQTEKGKTEKNQKKTNRTKRKWIRRCLLAVVGLILGLNLYFANAGVILGNQLPMPFGYGLANVLSGSMEPTFSKGTLLLVKETQDIQEGDIVVYQSENELIVHRVIYQSGNEIITQGDANNVADEPFDKTQIKGKVIAWIPILGSVAAFLKTPAAVILILILAFVLIEGSFQAQKDVDDAQMDVIKEEIRRLKAEIEEKEKQ